MTAAILIYLTFGGLYFLYSLSGDYRRAVFSTMSVIQKIITFVTVSVIWPFMLIGDVSGK